MKRCRKCGELKPLADFYKMRGMRDGHRNECKVCDLAAKAARYRANPRPAIERANRWNKAHPDRVAKIRKAYRDSGRGRENDRRTHLRRKYGITIEHYDEMLASQGGACAICHRSPRPDISLHVDHCHESGTIRGLICFRCNNALGDFGDDPELLQRAISYLMRQESDDARPLVLRRVRALPKPRWAA